MPRQKLEEQVRQATVMNTRSRTTETCTDEDQYRRIVSRPGIFRFCTQYSMNTINSHALNAYVYGSTRSDTLE